MLNLCGIVAAILKIATGKKISMSGINSGHHYPGAEIGKNKIFWRKIVIFHTKYPSSNNKTLNARLLARVITGCHYT
jgi:hypothetical protein